MDSKILYKRISIEKNSCEFFLFHDIDDYDSPKYKLDKLSASLTAF